MSWEAGYHTREPEKSSYEELAEVKGVISEEEAQIWFAKFCQANLFFTVKLLLGVELDLYQEIKLRAFFLRDFCLNIEGRGVGKSFTISIFIILYAIFNPGCKIGICSGTFRQSKLIFKQIEKFINSSDGKYLKQCLRGQPKHDPDGYEMNLGGSLIMAVPLTERIRGLRFNKVIIDEYLLVPTEIVNNVIRPFLTARQSSSEEDKIRRFETELIKDGLMKESERKKFRGNSVIGLSSASFKFEDLYKELYLGYIKRIMNPKAEDVNHLVFKLSYEAVEHNGRLDRKLIAEGRENSSKSQFDREYRAIFTDEGNGYFSYTSLQDATVGVDNNPLIKVKGDPNKKYILAIDPNYSESETADHFAMALLEIDEESKSGALVHAYALANSKINKRSKYLQYLLDNFNIVYIILDNAAGPRFISDSEQFLGGFSRPLSELPDTFLDGEEGLREARRNYNPGSGKIVHYQVFNKSGWIRTANEILQSNIERRKILFGGHIGDKNFQRVISQEIPIQDLEFRADCDSGVEKMVDFIDHLNYMVDLTKKELTLIEVSSNSSGHQTFDLPSNLKGTSGPNKVRRDSYTALLLASYALHCYWLLRQETYTEDVFMPCFVG